MKFLQTVRFDASDARVFARPAEAGEWAVSGAFEFTGLAGDAVTGKTRQAFRNGFLGLATFGRATVAAVAEMSMAEHEAALGRLAAHLVAAFGAPDEEAGRAAAGEEMAFVAELCAGQPVNTLFAVAREFDGEGRIRERFRIVTPPEGRQHARIWEIVEDDA